MNSDFELVKDVYLFRHRKTCVRYAGLLQYERDSTNSTSIPQVCNSNDNEPIYGS